MNEINQRLRNEMKQRRLSMTEEKRREASEQICLQLYELLAERICQKQSLDLYLYHPLFGEVSLLPLFFRLCGDSRIRFFFPVTKKEGIVFYRAQPTDPFREGSFHVMEPVHQNNDRLAPLSDPKKRMQMVADSSKENEPASLIFVPGLAFSKKGRRLGYGGGYYDRFLSETLFCKRTSIGVCFSIQLTEEIVSFSWDMEMDHVVTEEGVIL